MKYSFLIVLLILACTCIDCAYSQSTNDTIYVYEIMEVYDTVFVNDTIWERNAFEPLSNIEQRDATLTFLNTNSISQDSLLNSYVNNTTISESSNILSDSFNTDSLERKSSSVDLYSTSLNPPSKGMVLDGNRINNFTVTIGAQLEYGAIYTDIVQSNESVYNDYAQYPKAKTPRYTLLLSTNLSKRLEFTTGFGMHNISTFNNAFHGVKHTQNYLIVPTYLSYNAWWIINIHLGVDHQILRKEYFSESTYYWKAPVNSSKYDPRLVYSLGINIFKYVECGIVGSYFFQYYTEGTSIGLSSITNEWIEKVWKAKHTSNLGFFVTVSYPIIGKNNNKNSKYSLY